LNSKFGLHSIGQRLGGIGEKLTAIFERVGENFPATRIRRYKKKIKEYRRWEKIYAEELSYLRSYCARLEKSVEPPAHDFLNSGRRFEVAPAIFNEEVARYSFHYQKVSRTRDKWSGLSAEQAFSLEVACLERLRSIKVGNSFHPFPEILSGSPESLEIEMSHCGLTLPELASSEVEVHVPDWEQQVNNIVALLEKAGVMHFDIHPNGQNLCVNEHGQLSLIDFDIAVLRGVEPYSFQIHDRYVKALDLAGSYPAFALRSLREVIDRNRKLLNIP
tara:strand:- start:1465 stop:2289 length:825 start_codon:yes stop_codon:yes gene_type:complete